jgi:uncharacterized protein DUF6285
VAHAIPTAGELAEAVREFLERDVMPGADRRLRFLTRVAVNVMAQLERELELGAQHARVHAERLGDLGIADDAELCRAIRERLLDERMDEVVAVTRAGVVERLLISNPRYLQPRDRSI